jgi:hypothetical protein
LAGLAKAIDASVKSNSSKNLRAFVCGVGGVTEDDLKKIGDVSFPLTIAVEKDGPGAYKLNKEAQVTVLMYNARKLVVFNYATNSTADLTKAKVDEIVKSVDKLFQ